MLQAAVNTNRFAVVYEIAKDYIRNAADRFGLAKLYEAEAEVVSFRIDRDGQLSLAI